MPLYLYYHLLGTLSSLCAGLKRPWTWPCLSRVGHVPSFGVVSQSGSVASTGPHVSGSLWWTHVSSCVISLSKKSAWFKRASEQLTHSCLCKGVGTLESNVLTFYMCKWSWMIFSTDPKLIMISFAGWKSYMVLFQNGSLNLMNGVINCRLGLRRTGNHCHRIWCLAVLELVVPVFNNITWGSILPSSCFHFIEGLLWSAPF